MKTAYYSIFYRKNPDIGNSRRLLPPLLLPTARSASWERRKPFEPYFEDTKNQYTYVCDYWSRGNGRIDGISKRFDTGDVAQPPSTRVDTACEKPIPSTPKRRCARIRKQHEFFRSVCVCVWQSIVPSKRREFIDRFVGTLAVNKQTTYGSSMHFWHLFTTCDVGLALFYYFLRGNGRAI